MRRWAVILCPEEGRDTPQKTDDLHATLGMRLLFVKLPQVKSVRHDSHNLGSIFTAEPEFKPPLFEEPSPSLGIFNRFQGSLPVQCDPHFGKATSRST